MRSNQNTADDVFGVFSHMKRHGLNIDASLCTISTLKYFHLSFVKIAFNTHQLTLTLMS